MKGNGNMVGGGPKAGYDGVFAQYLPSSCRPTGARAS